MSATRQKWLESKLIAPPASTPSSATSSPSPPKAFAPRPPKKLPGAAPGKPLAGEKARKQA